MRLPSTLLLLGIVLIATAHGAWRPFAVWMGLDFLALGIAHASGRHRVFGKRSDGTLPLWSWMLFLPLLAFTNLVWLITRYVGREPACNQITDQLVVGRRLYPAEVVGAFENYVDLAAEFFEPRAIRSLAAYVSFPILDGAAPTPEALRGAVAGLRPGRTFVHCAQGHGRTGLFAMAVLLHSGGARTVEEALELLRSARPAVRLNAGQLRCIEAFASRQDPA